MGTDELRGRPNKLRGVTCNRLASGPGEVEILLAASCYRNRDKLRQAAMSQSAPRLHVTGQQAFQ